MKPEIASYIASQYFSLPEPRPFLVAQLAKNGDGLRALSVLNSEARSAAAKFFVRDLAFIDAVLSTAQWDVQRPIIRVQFLHQKTFENWVRDYSRGIEQINLAPEDNPLNSFLTKPTKRADLVVAILQETLTPELTSYLADYGFTVAGKLEDFCGLPRLMFWVRCGASMIAVSLDCWSGTVSATFDHAEKYIEPSQTQALIKQAMDDILSDLTRPGKG